MAETTIDNPPQLTWVRPGECCDQWHVGIFSYWARGHTIAEALLHLAEKMLCTKRGRRPTCHTE